MNERHALDFVFNKVINSEKKVLNRKRKKDSMTENTMSKNYKNNYYAILDDDLEECNEAFEKFQQYVHKLNNESEQTRVNNSPNNNNKPSTSVAAAEAAPANVTQINESTATTNTKSKSNNKNIPPINTLDVESKEIIKLIKNGLKITQFKIKEYNQNKLAIYLTNLEDYKRVRGYLEKANVKYYSYTPKCLKTKTYLLKGLNGICKCEEFLIELCSYQNDNLKILKVRQFTTKKSVQRNISLPIFMVQVTAESNINELKSINCILYHCIKWEHLRRPQIPQCRNCQNFYHSAANCNMPPRCVKCSGAHNSKECPSSIGENTEKENLYCVLCKKSGHPASYRGCERYKELQQKLRLKKQNLTITKTSNPTRVTNPNLSYANVAREAHGALNTTNDQNIQNSFLVELKNTMLSLSNQIINLQKQLELQTARVDAICGLMNTV